MLEIAGREADGGRRSSPVGCGTALPVRCSARGVGRCGLWCRPKTGCLSLVRRRCHDLFGRHAPTACTCALACPSAVSGFPIRPVLKHGPRSLTCVRVSGCGNPLRRKEADWRDLLMKCTVDRPRSSEKGSSVSMPVGTRKMVNYA